MSAEPTKFPEITTEQLGFDAGSKLSEAEDLLREYARREWPTVRAKQALADAESLFDMKLKWEK